MKKIVLTASTSTISFLLLCWLGSVCVENAQAITGFLSVHSKALDCWRYGLMLVFIVLYPRIVPKGRYWYALVCCILYEVLVAQSALSTLADWLL